MDGQTGRTILIVEDNERIGGLIQRNLSKAGFRTEWAKNGTEAIQALQHHAQSLVVLDYELPDMPGKHVAETLIRNDHAVPFVMMIAQGDQRLADEMRSLGARECIEKDASFLSTLPNVLQKVIAQLDTDQGLPAPAGRPTTLEDTAPSSEPPPMPTPTPPTPQPPLREHDPAPGPAATVRTGTEIPTIERPGTPDLPASTDTPLDTGKAANEVIELQQRLADTEARLRQTEERYRSLLADTNTLVETTEKKLAEIDAKLRDREEQFQDLFDNANDMIQSIDAEGRFVYVNSSWLSTLGYDPEHIQQLRWTDVVAPEESDHFGEVFRELQKGNELNNVQTTFLTKDGRRVFVEGNLGARMKDGKFVATRGIFRDVTERKNAEEEKRIAEERYRTVFENSAVAITVTDENETIVSWNKFAEEILGMDKDDLENRPVRTLYPPEEWERLRSENVRQKGMQRHLETRMVRKDGEIIDVDLSVSVLRGPDGQVTGSIGVIADITERKRAEETARATEARLRSLADEADGNLRKRLAEVEAKLRAKEEECGILFDAEQQLIETEDRLAETEKKLEAAEARLAEQLEQSAEITRLQRELEKTRAELARTEAKLHEAESRSEHLDTAESTIDQEMSIEGQEAERRLAEAEAKLRESQEQCRELLKSERKLREAEEKLQNTRDQSSELAELGRRLAETESKLAETEAGLRESERECQELRERLQQATQTGPGLSRSDEPEGALDEAAPVPEEIVAETLPKAREMPEATAPPETIRLHPIDFDIVELLEGLCDEYGPAAHLRGIELECYVEPDVPKALRGDAERLRQVFASLMDNALKFTDEGGVFLQVRMGAPEFGDRKLSEIELVCSVTDTGAGIPPKKLDAIFQAFARPNVDNSEHVGRGLATAKRIVELMGGRILAESKPGEGSTFYFSGRFGSPPSPEDHVIEPPQVRVDGLRILVIDDTDFTRSALRKTLANLGGHITEAANASEALTELRLAKEIGHAYELILLDARMPGIDGFQLISKAREQSELRSPFIMMVTSDEYDAASLKAEEVGAMSCLVKPIKRRELLEALSRLEGATVNEPELERPAEPEPTAANMLPELRILTMQGDRSSGALVASALREAGCQVDLAENGVVGVARFKSSDYDLAFVDFKVPLLDGFACVAHIRNWETEQGRDPTPLIALADGEDAERDARALEKGFTAILHKPFTEEDVRCIVAKEAGETEAETAPVPQGSVLWSEEAPSQDTSSADEIEESADTEQLLPVITPEEAIPEPEDVAAPAEAGDRSDPVVREGFEAADEPDEFDAPLINDEQFESALPTFLAEARQNVADIKEALQTGDFKTIKKIAQSTKSAAKKLGIHAVARESQKIEKACKDKKAEQIEKRLVDLEDLIG